MYIFVYIHILFIGVISSHISILGGGGFSLSLLCFGVLFERFEHSKPYLYLESRVDGQLIPLCKQKQSSELYCKLI